MPLVCRSDGASLGAGIIVRAGSTACPSSVAGKAVCACTGRLAASAKAAPRQRVERRNMKAVKAE